MFANSAIVVFGALRVNIYNKNQLTVLVVFFSRKRMVFDSIGSFCEYWFIINNSNIRSEERCLI